MSSKIAIAIAVVSLGLSAWAFIVAATTRTELDAFKTAIEASEEARTRALPMLPPPPELAPEHP